MEVIYILLPLSLVFVAGAVFAFARAVSAGQMDDLETPPWRVLADEEEERGRHSVAGSSIASADGGRAPRRDRGR